MSKEYQESLHFVMSHPEAVARNMTDLMEKLKEAQKEKERYRLQALEAQAKVTKLRKRLSRVAEKTFSAYEDAAEILKDAHG